MHTTRKNKKKQKNSRSNSKGGKAIGSGAYGCVFKPALKCEGDTSRPDGIVSKLMRKEDAEQEFQLVSDIRPRIERIPNNQEYFIIGGTLCQPQHLVSPDDKLERNCNIFGNMIDINRYISNYKILNYLDGGIDLTKYIKRDKFQREKFDSQQFRILNDGLIRLLQFGIVPMNKAGVFHTDVKADNILIDSEGKCRLIDWGLAIVYDEAASAEPPEIEAETDAAAEISGPAEVVQTGGNMSQTDLDNKLLSGLEGGNIQYNIPLGVVLFNPDNKRKFERGPSTVLMNILAGNVHYEVLKFYSDLLDKNKTISDKKIEINSFAPEMLVDLWNEYKQRDNPKLEYFNEVFKHNVDIYGLLTVYFYVYEHFPSDLLFKSSFKGALIKRLLRNILVTYIFSDTYAKTKYNVDEIIQKLSELSIIANATESDVFYLTRKTPEQLGILSLTPDSEISEIISHLMPATTGGRKNKKKYIYKTRKLRRNRKRKNSHKKRYYK